MDKLRPIADEEARRRSKAGQERQLRQWRTDFSTDPARGGSKGYKMKYRLLVLGFADEHGVKEASDLFNVSRSSIYNWYVRLHPFRRTGNGERTKLVGRDQLLLALGVYIYPLACADELCAFIVANGGEVYERFAIYKRLKEMEITRKKGSIEAFEGYSDANLNREFSFFNSPPRAGVQGVRRYRLIDIDEARFSLKGSQSKYGWAGKPFRVRDRGHYKRNMASVNLIMGVEPGNPDLPAHVRGSVDKPRRWFLLTTRNCDQHLFGDFMEMLCSDIEQNPVPGTDASRILLWDNLSVHSTDYVTNTYSNRAGGETEFIAVPRPPYKPRFAPIEYIFCKVAMQLQQKMKNSWTFQSLRTAIHNICLSLGRDGSFNRTFTHCRY